MASRSKKPQATKQTASRKVHSAPARSGRNLNPNQQQKVPDRASRSSALACARKYSCTACNKCFHTNTELLQHSRDKHEKKPPGVNPCKHQSLGTQQTKQAKGPQFSSATRHFSTPHELDQHCRDKHQANYHSKVTFVNVNSTVFTCVFCKKHLSSGRELMQHTRDKHKIDEKDFSRSINSAERNKSSKRSNCIYCSKIFSCAGELTQHQRDKHKIEPSKGKCEPLRPEYNCPECSCHFKTKEALSQHSKDIHLKEQLNDAQTRSPIKRKFNENEFKCLKCPKHFQSIVQLNQHMKDKHLDINQARKHEPGVVTYTVKSDKIKKKEQYAMKRNERKKVIDAYYAKKVDIDKDEKRISVKLVNDTLSLIMQHVNGQKGGDIYCPNHVKAGSFPVNTKIGKPDEFDTNICLKLHQHDVKVSRGKSVNYTYGGSEHATNMNIKCDLNKTRSAVKAPNSYAVASTTCDKIPDELMHGNDLVPREIRYDLYQKIRTAKAKLGLKYVDLSRDAHGPALTLTIHPPKRYKIQHHISVDITVSLPCSIPIENWPRRATKQAFSTKLITEVKDTGTHLVPKKNEFWAVSYSKAEKTLFSRLDEGNGCRKFVYKMLKKYMQSCKSHSTFGLPGMSSHVLKTQLLWSCERHTSPEFWHFNNRDVCLVETLGDLEKALRNGHLPDYFDSSVDILNGKDSSVCAELANYLRDKRCELEQ